MRLKNFNDLFVWFLIIVVLIVVFLYAIFPESFEITGRAGSGIGLVGLTVLDPIINISIVSPENTTYNFDINDVYNVSLNLTSDFEVNTWWYDLYDLKHNVFVNESIIFTPNMTIEVVRWSNLLIVHANHTVGTEVSANVTFFVQVPNSAPILGEIDDEILICENDTLNYYFNATDADENLLVVIDINPKDPFYVNPTLFVEEYKTFFESEIISEPFVKSDIGFYEEVISIYDGEYVDTANLNITIIEINNAPIVEDIGAQTVWSHGENSSFYYELVIDDLESGNASSGNFSFEVTFFNGNKFFDISNIVIINDTTGDSFNASVINFTANDSIIGAYNISVCVTDRALTNISSNISLCGQNGLNLTSCQNFSLAITDENRAPTIVSYSPVDLNFDAFSLETLEFTLEKYDPDGNIPDTYWYVDNVLIERDIGSLEDSFNYAFRCGISGIHPVSVIVTDGLLNDSLDWFVNVSYVACPTEDDGDTGGGGGGGAGTIASGFCAVDWICKNWDVCKNIQASLEIGLITGNDYRVTQESCVKQGLFDTSCGIQIRDCFDLNFCNSTRDIPNEFQSCYYIEEPSCFDGIRNCHSGDCELLTDCGGVCKPCSTCSDKIQNQGEKGVDCGGPCPWLCIEKISFFKQYGRFLLWLLLLILLIIIIVRIIRIVKLRKELGGVKTNQK